MKLILYILVAILLTACGDDDAASVSNVSYNTISPTDMETMCGDCTGYSVWSYDLDIDTCFIYLMPYTDYASDGRYVEELGTQYRKCL